MFWNLRETLHLALFLPSKFDAILEIYSDFDCAQNVKRRRARLEHIVFQSDASIAWSLMVQNATAMSTLKTECLVIQACAKDVVHLRNIVSEQERMETLPETIIRQETLGCIKLTTQYRVCELASMSVSSITTFETAWTRSSSKKYTLLQLQTKPMRRQRYWAVSWITPMWSILKYVNEWPKGHVRLSLHSIVYNASRHF